LRPRAEVDGLGRSARYEGHRLPANIWQELDISTGCLAYQEFTVELIGLHAEVQQAVLELEFVVVPNANAAE
jgi:hypothetical protein